MKRLINKVLLLLLVVFMLSFSFMACDNNSINNNETVPHVHEFSKQVVADKYLARSASCTEKALYYYSCKCGESGGMDTFEYGDFDHFFNGNICISCGERITSSIYFGQYPQSRVNDVSIIEQLLNKAGNPLEQITGWTSYNYFVNGKISDCMYYRDVELNGEKYRGVYIRLYRPYLSNYASTNTHNAQLGIGYVKNAAYWFKYEPLKWTIINEENGCLTLLCETIIDSQEFDFKENNVFSNNYAQSLIRAWLNDTFYHTAFNESEKDKIQITEVDNSVSSTCFDRNEFACENTFDKVYLLSCEETSLYLSKRMCQKLVSDYAQSQGGSLDEAGTGYGYWWLRSPDNELYDLAATIYPDGKVYFDYYDDFVVRNYVSVVPAINIRNE